MPHLWYATHPEVRIDGDVPIPRWGLTDTGRRRAEAMCRQPWIGQIERLISSSETKALELAAIVAAHTGLAIEVRPETDETDRSSTGFIPPDEYGPVSDEWFAEIEAPPSGWESAGAVQRRMVATLDDVLSGSENVLVAGHGGAGTLLWCALAGEPIAASRDQPGAGYYFTVDLASRTPLHAWRPIDDLGS